MAQHDYDIANAPGVTARADINAALQAIVSQNSGATAPSTTFAYQWWADTTTGLLKIRNAANSAWVTLGTLAAANLGLLPLTGGTLTGLLALSGAALNEAQWTDIASAASTPLGAANGNYGNVTGTTTITSFDTIQAGTTRKATFTGILTLTHNATSLILPTAANITTAAGDSAEFVSLGSGNWKCIKYMRADGSALFGSGTSKIQPVTASVASNALTATLNPTTLDFRSSTLGSGTVNTRSIGTATSLTVASGATLGTTNATASRLVLLAIDNAGTVELAIANFSGGLQLDETNLISTTALSGSSNSASTIYSTTARSNVPYRVVGFLDITETTAGTWATAPSEIQGTGGLASQHLNALTLATTQNTTSGTSIDFTSIPAWVKRITLQLNGVSTNGTASVAVRLGAGSILTTGYLSSAAYGGSSAQYLTDTTSFVLEPAGAVSAAATRVGAITFTHMGGNVWACSGTMTPITITVVNAVAGTVSLGGTLDRLRLTTLNGTDTFDAGSVNIMYE